MLKRIYKYLALAGTALITALYVLLQRSKQKTAELEREQLEAESEALSRINEGIIAGQKAYDKTTDTKLDRGHFGRVRQYPGGGSDPDS